MDLGLRNRKAIVLAASKGLGRAVAEVLASEGCAVALCARHLEAAEAVAEDLRRRFKVDAYAFACDVSNAAELERFFDLALGALGHADILVNNAGGPPAGAIESLDDAAWGAAVELTLMSVVRACRRVLPHMKAQQFGRIVNITSVSMKQPIANMALSNTLRAAVAGYAKTLAAEVALHGITVHCVMPGSFLTDRNRDLGADIAAKRGIPFAALIDEWQAGVPVGRMGDPLEFGRMVAFLASDACSFTTGTCVAVDGGQIKGLL